jgi:hypothetical protein
VWLPVESVVVLKVAMPEAFSTPIPSCIVPSRNVTLPVGTKVRVTPVGPVTVAVKVTAAPL